MSPGVAILCISLHILSIIWWLVNDISTLTVDKRGRIPTPMRPILFLNSRFYDAPFKLPLWHLISERWRVWSTVTDFCTVDTSFVLALLGWLLALTDLGDFCLFFFTMAPMGIRLSPLGVAVFCLLGVGVIYHLYAGVISSRLAAFRSDRTLTFLHTAQSKRIK